MNQDENYFWTNFIHRNPTNSVFIVQNLHYHHVIECKLLESNKKWPIQRR